MSKLFKNYKELLEENEKIARELLADKGVGDWQDDDIYQHEDVEAFTEYELIEGWYIDLNLDRDFNGAPNPLHFINLEELGNALVRNWDDSVNYKSTGGEILQTSYGW